VFDAAPGPSAPRDNDDDDHDDDDDDARDDPPSFRRVRECQINTRRSVSISTLIKRRLRKRTIGLPLVVGAISMMLNLGKISVFSISPGEIKSIDVAVTRLCASTVPKEEKWRAHSGIERQNVISILVIASLNFEYFSGLRISVR